MTDWPPHPVEPLQARAYGRGAWREEVDEVVDLRGLGKGKEKCVLTRAYMDQCWADNTKVSTRQEQHHGQAVVVIAARGRQSYSRARR